jgi:hypothetical protein
MSRALTLACHISPWHAVSNLALELIRNLADTPSFHPIARMKGPRNMFSTCTTGIGGVRIECKLRPLSD